MTRAKHTWRRSSAAAIGCAAALCVSGGGALAQGDPALALGEQLATQCVSCHQVFVGSRARRASGVPEIRGQSSEKLIEHLSDFRSGRRPHLIMSHIAQNLNEAEMLALARYYSAMAPD